MKTSSAKAKGRNFQKWACKKVSELLHMPWGYGDDKDIQPRLMGSSGTDVALRGAARDLFLFDIECKATETFHIYTDIAQAQVNTAPGRYWLLFHKKNRSLPIVILDAELFFKILANTKDLHLGLKK